MMNFSHINKLKNELDQLRPLPPEAIKNLSEVYRVEWTYHSNAIEGNTLSLNETKIVLEEGLTIGGKRLREHLEVINHSEAIDFVTEYVSQNQPVNENALRKIHYLILKNIDNKNAGAYRQVNVRISGSEHKPPHFLQVQNEIEKLFTWYEEKKGLLHPVELAAFFHFRFVYIHPFSDGNGRTARLLMNFILMNNGYPPAIVKAEDKQRARYYKTLEMASVDQNAEPFIGLISECAEDSLNDYLNTVR
ncbi:Fic family protein [Lentibacillus salicampi]|uniref:Fic family protein n=1 Tax=Lentibacillus salicampi TaxID=175306 RepID=A0A4Y9AEZ6_9BACI|nr:Fic family protein [Lentibacillus salicampi]TFJ94396.1 Fic family protein [Lentibacillus salicampi]